MTSRLLVVKKRHSKFDNFNFNRFDALTENFSTLKKSVTEQLATLTQTVGSWETRIQNLELLSEKVNDCTTEIVKRDHKISSLHTEIQSLQEQLNIQEQSYLRNELEITGVTETENENLHHLVTVTATLIGMNLQPNDIDRIIRVGSKPTPSPNKPKDPRPIVVRFTRNTKRNDMIQAARVRKEITTKDIEIDGPSKRMYFNERLTKENRKLFREVRIRAKSAGYKFYWVKNGCIMCAKKKKSCQNTYATMTISNNLSALQHCHSPTQKFSHLPTQLIPPVPKRINNLNWSKRVYPNSQVVTLSSIKSCSRVLILILTCSHHLPVPTQQDSADSDIYNNIHQLNTINYIHCMVYYVLYTHIILYNYLLFRIYIPILWKSTLIKRRSFYRNGKGVNPLSTWFLKHNQWPL